VEAGDIGERASAAVGSEERVVLAAISNKNITSNSDVSDLLDGGNVSRVVKVNFSGCWRQ
jgi:hypothetical protein